MKHTYYKLSGSVEPSVSGIRETSQIYDFVDPQNTNPMRMSLYQEYSGREALSQKNLDLHRFRMRDNANVTNVLTTAFLDRGGLFVSEKLKEIIELHSLYKTCFYSSRVTQKDHVYSYHYMNTLSSVELIEFERSEFIRSNIIDHGEVYGEPFRISSYEDFVKMKRDELSLRSGKTIVPKKLVLKNHYDLFREPLGVAVLISEKLKSRLLEEGIDDVHLEELKYEMCELV